MSSPPVSRPVHSRSRIWLVGAVIATIALGLASRRYPIFPAALDNYPGDALWALMIFIGVALVRPRLAPLAVGLVALAVCYAVEFAQLIQAPWLNSIRGTMPGRLVLGSGFDWLDLCAFVIGVLAGVFLDSAFFLRTQSSAADASAADITRLAPRAGLRRRIAANYRAALRPLWLAVALGLTLYGGTFCWHFEVFGRPALNRERGWLGPCLRGDPHTSDIGGAGYYESSDYRRYDFYRPLCRAWIWMQGLPYEEFRA